MSSKNVKTARRVARKEARARTRDIANAQIIELFKAPFFVRLRFAFRVLIRK